MGDFFQNGLIATFHRLRERSAEELETEVLSFSRQRPIVLVLPCLYAELGRPALSRIIDELKGVSYLAEIVVSLGGADSRAFDHAREFFGALPQQTRIVWHTGPRIGEVFRLLEAENVPPGEDGKGRAVWIALGYVLGARRAQVIALHDCDIATYSRDMLARLVYPVADPDIDYEYSKGYYARLGDRLYGRATRLLVTPLVRALDKVVGGSDFLRFIDSFRYPLAGEFAMLADLGRRCRIPGDWGLELGLLAEVFRNVSVKRVCQVDLCDRYDHKHQPLGSAPDQGLRRMARDLAICIFRNVAATGVVYSDSFFRTLKSVYIRTAQDAIERYYYDAVLNGLKYDRHEEEKMVEVFIEAMLEAGASFLRNPMGAPLIPTWNRVTAAIPDIYERIVAAVEEDNAGVAPARGLPAGAESET